VALDSLALLARHQREAHSSLRKTREQLLQDLVLNSGEHSANEIEESEGGVLLPS